MTKIKQRLRAEPSGVIKGGYVDLIADAHSGELTSSGKFIAQVLMFEKDIALDGAYKVDPKLLLSKSVKAGVEYDFGPLKIVCAQIKGKHAVCKVTHADYPEMDGTGVIDLSREFISIVEIHLVGRAHGFAIDVKAHP